MPLSTSPPQYAIPRVILLAGVFLPALAHRPPLAQHLSVNGLLPRDAACSPFPRDGPFIMSWVPAGPVPTSSSSLELHLAAEGALTWNRFFIASTETSFLLPSNLTSTFQDDATYQWRIQTGHGVSAVAFFDIAPSPDAVGNATWIGGGSELRADWTLPSAGGKVLRARAYLAGLGLAELYINGAKVGDHVADPGEAVFDHKYLYVSFNITTLLRGGQINAIGGRVGNGKFGYLDIFANRTAVGDQSGDSTRAFKVS